MMTHRCNLDGCFPDTTCAMGHLDRNNCEHWIALDGTEIENGKSDVESETSDIPWNSYSLGMSDLAILGGRGSPIVVGLAGAPGSGKTTLLAYLYMWLLEYGELSGWTFAGSWTFGGWESIVQQSRWTGEPPPSFPPHTSSAGRVPGLLHISLRNEFSSFRDVLFTDAPGEWFTQWAKTPGIDRADGACWVMKHADILLLLADSDALKNTKTLPKARRNTRDLIERIGSEAPHIPLFFTWTKTDIEVPEQTKKSIEKSRLHFASYSKTWGTTIEEPQTIADYFSNAIILGDSYRDMGRLSIPISSNEPFLSLRGADVQG